MPTSRPGEQRTIIGVVGTTPLPPTLDEMLEAYAEVEQVVRVTKKYKLSGWDFHPQKTIIKVLDFEIGGDEVIVIAGPCSVESEEQTHGNRARGQGRRRQDPARRRLQAAHLAVRVPRAWARRVSRFWPLPAKRPDWRSSPR